MRFVARVALVIVLVLSGMVRVSWGREDTDQHLKVLNAIAVAVYRQGESHEEGTVLAEQAHAYALEHFGAEDQHILSSLNNLAFMYGNQGRFSEVEPLYKQAYQVREKIQGKEHPDTLKSLNRLARFYQDQRRYSEAEQLFKQALHLNEKVLGKEHPYTLSVFNSLAGIQNRQGRYSEAEQLYKQALQLRRKVLGEGHFATLESLNNLAILYDDQGRYSEAESLYKQILQIREQVKGKEHSDTLSALTRLARFYKSQGRNSEAEPLYKQSRQRMGKIGRVQKRNRSDIETILGNFAGLYDDQERNSEAEPLKQVPEEESPARLASLNNMAAMYKSQGRYSDAEPLFKQVFQLRKKILGKEHPTTLTVLNNLAELYKAQSRYSEAESLLKEGLQICEKVLGKEHPATLNMQESYIGLLISDRRPAQALELLKDQEMRLLSLSFQVLYSTDDDRLRRLYLQRISKLQDMAFTLALAQSEAKYQRFAAGVVLRWKQLYAEESSFQQHLFSLSREPEMIKLRQQIAETRAALPRALNAKSNIEEIRSLVEQLSQQETAQLALARSSLSHLEVSRVTLEQVLAALPAGSGLVEYRFFNPFDFKTGDLAKLHVAVLVLSSDPKVKQSLLFHDLGPLGEFGVQLALSGNRPYTWLLGPLEQQISSLETLYIAPDNILGLLSFGALRLPDDALKGRFLTERQQINRLQTGRDLLKDKGGVSTGQGLVALGGIKYGPISASRTVAPTEPLSLSALRMARRFGDGFAYLNWSRREARNIFDKYATGNGNLLLSGEDASEYKLKHLQHSPRILHLSTHGFYLDDEGVTMEQRWQRGMRMGGAPPPPYLLSGLALAGANKGLQGKLDKHGDDGLLYSLEVLGLNLQGTELVSLSACDTGKGVVDYSEGVYGLVRAFRTAGAENVLMTLTPVGDKTSKDFMEKFYDHYLAENLSPSRALHKTRLDFIRNGRPVKDWSPYVMVGR